MCFLRVLVCAFEFWFAYVTKLQYCLWWFLTIQNMFKIPCQYYITFLILFENFKSLEWKNIFKTKNAKYIKLICKLIFFKTNHSWKQSHLCWNGNFEVSYLQQCMCLKYCRNGKVCNGLLFEQCNTSWNAMVLQHQVAWNLFVKYIWMALLI